MSTITTTTTRRLPKTIPLSAVSAYPDGPGRERWVSHDGRDYQLMGKWYAEEDLNELEQGGAWVTRPVDDPEADVPSRAFTRAYDRGPEGTWQSRMDAFERKRAKAAEKNRPLPVNTLALFDCLARGREVIAALPGPVREDPLVIVPTDPANQSFYAFLPTTPSSMYLPGRAAVTTWAGVVALCERKGIDLRISAGGQLLVRPPRGRPGAYRGLLEVLHAEERGIVSVLTNQPIQCTTTLGCARDAVTTAFPRSPWCLVCDGVKVNDEEAAA